MKTEGEEVENRNFDEQDGKWKGCRNTLTYHSIHEAYKPPKSNGIILFDGIYWR